MPNLYLICPNKRLEIIFLRAYAARTAGFMSIPHFIFNTIGAFLWLQKIQ